MLKTYILNILAVLTVSIAYAQVNILPEGDFESGSLSPFVVKNQGAGIEITEESTNGGDYAIKLTAGNASADAWSLQLATPVMDIVEGNSYQVSFDIRSLGAGQGRISLGATSFTHQYWPDFNTTGDWQTITYTEIYGDQLVALLTELEINFDMGYIMDMTYYIDNIQVIDLDAEPVVEYIANGTFETGIEGWAKWNGGDDALSHAAGSAYAAKLTAGSASTDPWSLQLATPTLTVVEGNAYSVSFDVRSTGVGKGRISLTAASFANQYWPDFNTTEEWQTITYTQVYGADLVAVLTELQINFDMGYITDMTYYIDNVVVTDVTAGTELLMEDFEEGSLGDFVIKNPGAGVEITQESTSGGSNGYESAGAMKVVNENGTPGEQWSTQIHTDFDPQLESGVNYVISYYIRSEEAGSVRCSTSGDTPHYQGDVATTSDWQMVSWEIEGNGTETGLNFDLGAVAGVYYIDNVMVMAEAGVSSDATLSDLTVDGTTIDGFASGTYSYSVELAAGTTTVPTVEATTSNAAATAAVTAASSLPGTTEVLVTAEDGTTTATYSISFTVATLSDDATLSDLTVDGTTVSGFASDMLTYAVELPAGTTTVPTVAATTTDAGATAAVNEATSLPGTTEVVVTAEDGTTTITYSVSFTVALSDVATLSDLTVDGTTVSGFAADVLTYTMELPAGTNTVPAVEATPTDASASAVVTPAASLPGTTEVVVTAEDGTTTTTYEISFTVRNILNSAIKSADFQIYPNPAVDVIHLTNLKGSETLKILDISGKEIRSMVSTGDQFQINVSNLKGGIYYLQINESELLKFIKR